MAKMTFDELRKLRKEQKAANEARVAAKKEAQILVGLGTSGIAAGAKIAFDAFAVELKKHGQSNVALCQTGSLGLDYAEPTVEVRVPGMPDIVYGKVNAEIAKQIVEKHIIGKELVSGYVYHKPAKDIVK